MKDYGCPFKNGDIISCDIRGTVVEGEIAYIKNDIYLLHNHPHDCDGTNPGVDLKRGYDKSWRIVRSDVGWQSTWTKGMKETGVSDMKLISSSKFKIRIEIEEESEVETIFHCKKKRKLNIQ